MLKVLGKKRDSCLDLAKFFAASFVILGHCLLAYVSSSHDNPIMNLIWLIQMPLFMVISGFLTPSETKINNLKAYLIRIAKNTLTLLLPYLTFLLIRLTYTSAPILNTISNAILDPETNLWFLWVLFFIELFFELGLLLSNKVKNKKIKSLTPIFISFIFIIFFVGLSFIFKFNIKLLGIKLFCYYTPFFCLGYIFKLLKRSHFYESNRYYKKIELSVFTISLAALLFYIFYFKSIMDFDDTNILYLFLRVMGSVFGVITILILCKYAVRINFFNKLAWTGKFSLEAYYLHIIFLNLLRIELINPSEKEEWIAAFMSFAFLIMLVALTITVMYFIPFLHFVLFGKTYSTYDFERHIFENIGLISLQNKENINV